MSLRAIGLSSILIVGLVACSGPTVLGGDETEPPYVTLAGLSLSEPGPSGQTLTISLRLQNPNDVDLPIHHMRVALHVNDAPFASGVTSERFTLPDLGETMVAVAITMPAKDLAAKVSAVGTGQRLDYTLIGEVEIGSWFSNLVSFTRDGKLALPNLPG